ncbi:MAG: hypothetical protein ABI459_11310 [Deltaproteobacteria bacterium]
MQGSAKALMCRIRIGEAGALPLLAFGQFTPEFFAAKTRRGWAKDQSYALPE